MEKRLLLSFSLSFLVLFVWSLFFSPVKKPQNQIINSQRVGKKEDTTFKQTQPLESTTQSLAAQEIIETLENNIYLVQFSNMGGSIKKIFLKNYNRSLPISEIYSIPEFDSMPFTLSEIGKNDITYIYENDEYNITKSYQLENDNYSIKAQIILTNKDKMSNLDNIKIKAFSVSMSNLDNTIKNELKSEDEDDTDFNKNNDLNNQDKGLLEYVIYSEDGIHRKNNAYKFSPKENKDSVSPVNWVGYRNKYFCAIVKPFFSSTGHKVDFVDDKNLNILINANNDIQESSKTINLESLIYFGPEKIDILAKYGMDFHKIQMFYRFPLFDAIAKIIYALMHFMYKYIHNWGVIIILISFLIYISTYPLTLRGMLSMQKMQAMQPKIAALKEKYKNNPQKMNQEMMELYKKHKINPFGGCLPFLLQMPIFIGLYQVLWRSVDFKGADFLWINDLSEPDKLFTLSGHYPVIDNEINILPVLMMIIMAVQQRISAKNMVAADPAQAYQQKMMGIMMPLLMGFIFYKFASGLTLYFTMFYIYSTFTQWKMRLDKTAVATK